MEVPASRRWGTVFRTDVGGPWGGLGVLLRHGAAAVHRFPEVRWDRRDPGKRVRPALGVRGQPPPPPSHRPAVLARRPGVRGRATRAGSIDAYRRIVELTRSPRTCGECHRADARSATVK